MPPLLALLNEVAWPLALILAWIAGEVGARWTGLPRISMYSLIGFLLAPNQIGLLALPSDDFFFLFANIAFGFVLFEFAYRINIHWLRVNPWILVSGLLEAGGSFVALYGVARWFAMPQLPALLLASLGMATSPAGAMRIVNDLRSSGQVTERLLHLTALNCVLSVLLFKMIAGYMAFDRNGDILQPLLGVLYMVLASVALGLLFGLAVPTLLRHLGELVQEGTVAFALTVIFLVALTHAAKLSPVLAILTLGLVARHRRVTLSRTRRNFGTIGEIFTIGLFVYIAATGSWQTLLAGGEIGSALIIARLGAKVLPIVLLAPVSGIPRRKGLLTGLALSPLSAFAILMLEQARYLGVPSLAEFAALSFMALVLEVIGPIIAQQALVLANETNQRVD